MGAWGHPKMIKKSTSGALAVPGCSREASGVPAGWENDPDIVRNSTRARRAWRQKFAVVVSLQTPYTQAKTEPPVDGPLYFFAAWAARRSPKIRGSGALPDHPAQAKDAGNEITQVSAGPTATSPGWENYPKAARRSTSARCA